MPHQALMMLDAFNRLHPLDKDTLDFIRRMLNTAYQEGKLDGFRQFMGETKTNNNDELTLQHHHGAAQN